jgi:hypothetical protein
MEDRLNLEIDMMSVNQLNALGNQAVQMGLIIGHGYHRGQYEILRSGQVVTLSPQEAVPYLQKLIQSVQDPSVG